MERASGSLVSSPMLVLVFAAQLLAAGSQDADSSTALRALLDRAVERNRAVPASLHAYRAQVESEIAVLARRASGDEVALSVEQAQNQVLWRRSGAYEQRVTAYRARQAGPSLSALAVLRSAWTIPVLYGNRLSLFFGTSSSMGTVTEGEGAGGVAAPRAPAAHAVHPFGPGRDQVYTFSGGGTVAVLRTAARTITLARVRVEPKAPRDGRPVVVFRGEIDLDAERGEIVRMRGQFLTLGRDGPVRRRLLVLPVQVVAFVELESIEVDGRYWLPRYQRIESHVNLGGFAEGRSVFRIVSRFRHHEVLTGVVAAGSLPGDDVGADAAALAAEVASTGDIHRLTLARPDSLRRAVEWWQPLGASLATLRADDFADVAGLGGTASTPAALSWRVERLADLVHFNRVEGWTTGATVAWRPGARDGGVAVRAHAGWAWTERVARGRVELVRAPRERGWGVGMRWSRTLDITNDFTAPHDSGGALAAAVVGVDSYDYVDRTAGTVWADWHLVPGKASFRVEGGVSSDRAAPARLTRGPLLGGAPFQPNRGVDAGRAARAAVVADWNPSVHGSPLATGVGLQLRAEAAGGELEWRRATVRLTARGEAGAIGWAARGDAGILTSDNPPPQQLFEVGGGAAFPGFRYKEFAGDRAVAVHGRLSVRLPALRAPVRLFGCVCLVAPAPELALTLHGARLTASGAATLASIARLGTVGDRVGAVPAVLGVGEPVSRPTDGWRTSMDVGLRFFGGAVSVGATRTLEPGRRWRAMVALGQAW